jgi:two-component system chemotaxis response regulator CheY
MWISSSRRSPPSSPAGEPAELRECRLLALVVVDNPELRQTVRSHLEGMRIRGHQASTVRFTVVEAESGRAALSLLTAIAPDLVVVDLVLAEMSGYEFCERVRASGVNEQVPVIGISARAMPQDRAAAEEAGVTVFLAKPFTLRQLSEQIVPFFTAAAPALP